jgi:calmodulin
MAIELTGEEFEMIRDAFLELDENGDRQITFLELKSAFTTLEEEMVEFYLRLLDVNDSGAVEFPEFLEMYAFLSLQRKPNQTQVKQMFKALDKRNTGSLLINDVKTFCKLFSFDNWDNNTESIIDNLFESMDTNGDGEINYLEFLENYENLEDADIFIMS